jgi:ATP-dependent Clp protease, protease subunit
MSDKASKAQNEQEPEEPKMELFRGLIRYERQSPIRQISFYLSGNILESHYYTDLFYTLRTAIDTDLIYIHLNTSGGDFDTGLQIINNMQASSANIITVLEARAYSMGAFIFLAGDEWVVHDNCQLLFHIYSGSFAGKGNEQQAEVHAVSSWFEKFMTRTCQPFLTPAEIKDVLKGSDVWMDSDEIRRRMERIRRSQARLLNKNKLKTMEE